MRRSGAIAVLLLAGWVGVPPGWSCDSATCALLTRGQRGLLRQGAFQVDLSFRRTDQSVMLSGSRAVDRVLRPKVDLERRRIWPGFHQERGGVESFVQLDVGYGLTARTNLLASVPVFARRAYTIGHLGFESEYATRGVGDALLGVRHTLGPLIGGLSLQIPLGDHRLAGDFDGSILDPTLQPGSGAFGVVALLQWSRHLRGLDWSIAGSFQRATTNDMGYRFGDSMIGALGASRTLLPRLTASLQAKLVRQLHNRYLDERVPSTGSRLVYVNPGVRWNLPGASGLTAFGFLQLPVHRYVNDAQLAPRLALLVGVSRTFR